MKHLKALVMMQLKDKLDFSFLETKQKTISKVVFTVLKFLIVCVAAFVFFYLSSAFKIFDPYSSRLPKTIIVFIFSVIFILSVFSCTVGLMKNLYFADDNRVLITFPVNTDLIFVSRLIVYYVFELVRSYMFTVPIFIGFGIVNHMSVLFYLWLLIAFVIISALPVLLGAVLSIPAMFAYRFLQKVKIVKALLIVALAALGVWAAVSVIALIPENINLAQQIGTVQRYMKEFLESWQNFWYPVNLLVNMLVGKISGEFSQYTLLAWQTLINFAIVVVSLGVLVALAFLLSRPLFFSMMSKSFEFEKKTGLDKKPNKKKSKFITFITAEITSLLRSTELSALLGVYVCVPVLDFLINKIFSAMNTRLTGLYMVYSFNILLILLPMFASSAVVATLYSKEGRAAYIKKTFPLSPIIPLFIKLVPILVLSTLSMIASMAVFNHFARFEAQDIILLALSMCMFQLGNVVWCGMIDLMNPQNDQYATTGSVNDNPNEKKATIIAFILSVVIALFSFILFGENVAVACIKLFCIALVFVCMVVYMYCTKIKVYYAEK